MNLKEKRETGERPKRACLRNAKRKGKERDGEEGEVELFLRLRSIVSVHLLYQHCNSADAPIAAAAATAVCLSSFYTHTPFFLTAVKAMHKGRYLFPSYLSADLSPCLQSLYLSLISHSFLWREGRWLRRDHRRISILAFAFLIPRSSRPGLQTEKKTP